MDINTATEKKSVVWGQKKSKLSMGLIFLIFVIVLTAILYGYNMFIEKQNTALQEKISQLETSIATEKKDNKLVVSALLEANKKSITQLEKNSQIITYMKHLSKIKSDYQLDISGFNFSAGKLRVQAQSKSDDASLAYKKVVNFLKTYNADATSLFSVGRLAGIQWYDEMKFVLEFTTK